MIHLFFYVQMSLMIIADDEKILRGTWMSSWYTLDIQYKFAVIPLLIFCAQLYLLLKKINTENDQKLGPYLLMFMFREKRMAETLLLHFCYSMAINPYPWS